MFAAVLIWIVVVAASSGLTYSVIVGQPGDAVFRLLRPPAAMMLLMFVPVQLLSAGGLNFGLVVTDVAMLAAARLAWRKRKSARVPAKVPLPRETYLAMAAAVVGCHWALASLYADVATSVPVHLFRSASIFSTLKTMACTGPGAMA